MRLDTEGEPPCGPVAAPDSLVLGPRPARKGWGSRFEGLLGLTAGKAVEIRWHKRDRYGRVVGQVWVVSPDARCQGPACPKTLDAGLAQVTVGLAWHYKKYAGEQSEEDRERYSFAEIEARAKRAGLWRDAEPVAPWVWRRGR